MSAKRENELASTSERLRACGAFAGRTPVVPANHLTVYRLISSQLTLRSAMRGVNMLAIQACSAFSLKPS
jgi:hypothetical protein